MLIFVLYKNKCAPSDTIDFAIRNGFTIATHSVPILLEKKLYGHKSLLNTDFFKTLVTTTLYKNNCNGVIEIDITNEILGFDVDDDTKYYALECVLSIIYNKQKVDSTCPEKYHKQRMITYITCIAIANYFMLFDIIVEFANNIKSVLVVENMLCMLKCKNEPSNQYRLNNMYVEYPDNNKNIFYSRNNYGDRYGTTGFCMHSTTERLTL